MIVVVPRKTSYTPSHAIVGDPPLFRPKDKEVHISTVFTWDMSEALRLQKAWGELYETVKVGGPAFGESGGDFTPGRYIKDGVVFTSRGCPNKCDFCLVPEREGGIIELEIKQGHIIQDNNILACSVAHIEKVFQMLRKNKRGAVFSGGLEAGRINRKIVELMRSIRVREMFLAFDGWGREKSFVRAMGLLKDFPRNKKRTYVLIGRDGIESDTARLKMAWKYGALPFAQLYQPKDRRIEYSREYKSLVRSWSRPAAIKSIMKEYTTEGGE